jgi:hypothetical protein
MSSVYYVGKVNPDETHVFATPSETLESRKTGLPASARRCLKSKQKKRRATPPSRFPSRGRQADTFVGDDERRLMANETDFSHDQLGHLLADKLLEVPRFQRAYSWEKIHVEEYLEDLKKARQKDVENSYFMGTAVFANPTADGGRLQIVDGQQRLATTALFIIAIRDLLEEYGKSEQAKNMTERYLKGYVLSEEATVERLILSPKDVSAYNALLEGDTASVDPEHPISISYQACRDHLLALAPSHVDYGKLMEVSAQLEDKVQVLVAVASSLGEAYVIFETLNDRGADLTTADLLKNFLFSKAGSHMRYFEDSWVALESSFEKADELVRFIRFEYASRHGAVSIRRLYRAVQDDVESSDARKYLERLLKARDVYKALRDPENPFWSNVDSEVKDALLAYRRFGFESSFPVLIAALLIWPKKSAAKLVVKMAKWSVRAQFDGRIGGQASEEAFGNAAVAISSGAATTQPGVRAHLAKLIPTDAAFKSAFTAYGNVPSPRAKYLLAMLERANESKQGRRPKPLDWASTAVNIEHVLAQSEANEDEALSEVIGTIGNLALLERKLNRDLGAKGFTEKTAIYAASDFVLTRDLATENIWTRAEIESRTKVFAELACAAWPSH